VHVHQKETIRVARRRQNGTPAIVSEFAYAWKQIRRRPWLYAMVAPAVIYFLVFNYVPMYGTIIAFKDYQVFRGISASPWAGLEHFDRFYHSIFFWRLLRNTFLLSFFTILVGFPAPILLALALNEVNNGLYKRLTQTVTYFPHFISTVIVAGLVINLLSPTVGPVNAAIKALGFAPISFLNDPSWFRPVYVGSIVWQETGWGSIIYLAALAAIDPQLYDAAEVDGAGRFQKIRDVSLPGILPVIMVLLLLNLGYLLSVGFERVFLLYNPTTYQTADVYSTYVYRAGLLGQQFSYGTAIGLFNAIVSFVLLVVFNRIARRLGQQTLW
jgi:putative aldouronate transport system permease protein